MEWLISQVSFSDATKRSGQWQVGPTRNELQGLELSVC
jgi:hypothetical protein